MGGRAVAGVLLDGLLDAVLPQRCVVCGGFGAALHEDCASELPRADGPRCATCWRPGPSPCARCLEDPPALDGLRAALRFEGVARRALLEAKFGGVSALLDPLGRLAAEVVPRAWAVDAVVAVPLRAARQRQRGYNQAALLARAVGGVVGVPVAEGLVRRVGGGAPQASLGAAERRTNVVDAFAARGVPPSSLLVVDDITTTGATLEAMARALRAAGADGVCGLAVARED